VRNVARAADRKIMQPLRALIGDATQLLIAPDGELNLIPFEALVDEKGRFLVERYAIDYLSAGRDLLRMQTMTTAANRPVIFADPLFGEHGWTPPKAMRRSVVTGNDLAGMYFAPLGGTALEARDIKTLFQDAEVFSGAEASKASLKGVNAPGILHIATHGFFLSDAAKPENIQNPLLRSGLALAGANVKQRGGDDGILTALEASNLNLWGTKIVTLSACETGLGEVKNGEGVYGLRRAFFLAGAETVVMSLWSISDRVTREIMTAYYTGLKNGLGRGEALRQAQLAMLQRKDRSHPYYWSSFIQSGEWRSLKYF
jgi:CHAT domain-containing protein